MNSKKLQRNPIYRRYSELIERLPIKSVATLLIIVWLISGLIWSYMPATQKLVGQPATVFQVSPSLESGDTSMTGVIRKDNQEKTRGNYYLVLPDSRLIILNQDSYPIDQSYVNTPVTIEGYLEPLDSYQTSYSGVMYIKRITKKSGQ